MVGWRRAVLLMQVNTQSSGASCPGLGVPAVVLVVASLFLALVSLALLALPFGTVGSLCRLCTLLLEALLLLLRNILPRPGLWLLLLLDVLRRPSIPLLLEILLRPDRSLLL